MTLRAFSFWFTLLVTLVLGACQAPKRQTVYTPAPAVEEAEPAPAPIGSEELRRARLIADMLYDARIAYDNNQLLTPAGRAAYDRYREVLGIDPENAVARQGIVDIVLRYIDLANIEIAQGEYDNAASLLQRGASILPDRPELADARARLAVARQNKIENHPLDPNGLRNQSLEMMTQLAAIAESIRAREATFLINARTDDEGRWIYKVMREAVGGYRLRGDIGISGTPAILITLPKTSTCAAGDSTSASEAC
ncbi:MAG: tetratricopeptide repeat protein [Pseudomonadota bacterium]|nr:tetratricopeptide repeat protein [Pseudomonadota bacterium]